MKKLRWWEYPLALGFMMMLVAGGIHHSINSKGGSDEEDSV